LLEQSGERCYLRGGADTCTLRGEDCRYCGAFHAISEIVLSRPSDNVILRRQPKNLEILRPPLGGTQDDNYSLRGACPELAEGLRITEAGISGVVGQPLEAD